MKITALFLILVISSCHLKEKAELQLDQDYPTRCLVAESTMTENKIQTRAPGLFHHSEYKTDGYLISGRVMCRSTIAAFKNIELEISFYAESGATLRTQKELIYETIGPNKSIAFKFIVHPPLLTSYSNASVLTATPIK